MDYWKQSCTLSKLGSITNDKIRKRKDVLKVEKDVLNYIEILIWFGGDRWKVKVVEWSSLRRRRWRP